MDSSKQKAKSKWRPGAKISIGGREYIVKEREETAPKGLARAWIIATADGSRTYRWRPFRGLELTSGQPLVRKRRRTKPGERQEAPAAGGSRPNGALLGVIIDDIRENPRDGTKEFLTKVLGFFGVDLADGSKPAAKRRAAADGDGHDAEASGHGV